MSSGAIADAGVGDADPNAAPRSALDGRGAHGDAAAGRGELDGVGKQVQQYLLHAAEVRLQGRQIGGRP